MGGFGADAPKIILFGALLCSWSHKTLALPGSTQLQQVFDNAAFEARAGIRRHRRELAAERDGGARRPAEGRARRGKGGGGVGRSAARREAEAGRVKAPAD